MLRSAFHVMHTGGVFNLANHRAREMDTLGLFAASGVFNFSYAFVPPPAESVAEAAGTSQAQATGVIVFDLNCFAAGAATQSMMVNTNRFEVADLFSVGVASASAAASYRLAKRRIPEAVVLLIPADIIVPPEVVDVVAAFTAQQEEYVFTQADEEFVLTVPESVHVYTQVVQGAIQ